MSICLAADPGTAQHSSRTHQYASLARPHNGHPFSASLPSEASGTRHQGRCNTTTYPKLLQSCETVPSPQQAGGTRGGRIQFRPSETTLPTRRAFVAPSSTEENLSGPCARGAGMLRHYETKACKSSASVLEKWQHKLRKNPADLAPRGSTFAGTRSHTCSPWRDASRARGSARALMAGRVGAIFHVPVLLPPCTAFAAKSRVCGVDAGASGTFVWYFGR